MIPAGFYRRKMLRFGEHFNRKRHYRENPWYDQLFPHNPFLAVT